MESFGEKIKRLRKERGLNLVDIASAIGVNKSAVSFWENGTNEPKGTYIKALADFFEVSTDYLLGREDEWGNSEPTEKICQNGLTQDEQYLLDLYRSMDAEHKEMTVTTAELYKRNSATEHTRKKYPS